MAIKKQWSMSPMCIIIFHAHFLSRCTVARPFSRCEFPASVCGIKRLDGADRSILLQFKASVTESLTFKDWNITKTCANGWSGICTDSNGRVTEIGLPAVYVDGIIPSNFSKLTKLKYLDLSGNYFRSLPSSFGLFPVLSYLDLSFSYYSADIIPIIAKIKSLNTLKLHQVDLESIPDSLGLLTNLTYLDISYTLISKIPNSIGLLKNLTYLNVGRNSLMGLPSSLGSLPNLLELDLGQNQLNESVIDTIVKLKKLTSLYLGQNQFSIFPSKLSLLPSLAYLGLSDNAMRGSIPSSLSTLKNLSSLFFSNNYLCGPFPLTIAQLPKLKYFSLSNNFISGSVPLSVSSKFCDFAFDNNCLVAQSTKSCRIQDSHPNYYCDINCNPVYNLDKDLLYQSRNVTQSSVYSYGTPSLAVDGSAGKGLFSSHTCIHTLNESNPYFRAGLQSATTVKTVQLYNRLDCCSEKLNGVQVYVGSSGSKYNGKGNVACQDPKFKFGISSKGFPLNVTCNLFGSYVWVVVPGVKKILSLCEIVVLGK